MRLINTKTLQFEEFENAENLRYITLSHRWGAEEVLFADMINPGQAQNKKGYQKVLRFCAQAASRNFQYAWMDTCCIDKSSSAELSEAINSMWHWYQNADICLAFLADVSVSTIDGDFPPSEWFERGWTLQELLAPPKLEFFNADWEYLGSRDTLYASISAATGIRADVIQRRKPIQQCRVAERMSWASHRKTTRVEDGAYSLLGIFDVNMPLLYGEAEKAFIRLQEEIIKDSDDQSIFDWTEPAIDHYTVPSTFPPTGLLASSPRSFRHWHGKMYNVSPDISDKLFPPTITSCGLLVRFNMMPYRSGIFVAVLNYSRGSDSTQARPCIFLRMINFRQQFARVVVDRRHLVMSDPSGGGSDILSPNQNPLSLGEPIFGTTILSKEIYVPQKRYKLYNSATLGLLEPLACSISFKATPGPTSKTTEFVDVVARSHASLEGGRIQIQTDRPGALALFCLKLLDSTVELRSYKILLGFDPYLRPVCVVTNTGNERTEKIRRTTAWLTDDVSTKSLLDTTCMESQGWHFGEELEQINGISVAREMPHRPSFWPVLIGHSSHLNVFLQGGDCSLGIVARLTSSRLTCSITFTPGLLNHDGESVI